MIEKPIMELPEFSLPVSCKCSSSGLSGEFMVSEWKVHKYEFYFLWICLEHLLK